MPKIGGAVSPSGSSREADYTASRLLQKVPLSQAGEDLTREVKGHLTSQLDGVPFTLGATWLQKRRRNKPGRLRPKNFYF